MRWAKAKKRGGEREGKEATRNRSGQIASTKRGSENEREGRFKQKNKKKYMGKIFTKQP